MEKITRSAIRTARSLMAKGLLGQDLQSALIEAHPGLSEIQRTVVAARMRKEVGFLGQVAHDPNLFTTCKQAAVAKEKHPHPHTLIATYRTPLCATCSYNRNGACALMGGKLVASIDVVDDKIVDRTAAILVGDGLISDKEAEKILASKKLTPGKRAAALHLRLSLPVVDQQQDQQAQQQSRRIGSMLQNNTKVEINLAKTTGSRIAKNMEDRELDSTLDVQPGDEGVERRVAAFEDVLRRADFTVEMPGEPTAPRKDVRLATRSVFDVPEMDTGNHREASAVQEEHQNHVQLEHDKTIRTASKLLSEGEMNGEKAAMFSAKLDTLRQNGAYTSRRAARITRQLNALAGALEF